MEVTGKRRDGKAIVILVAVFVVTAVPGGGGDSCRPGPTFAFAFMPRECSNVHWVLAKLQ
jgi:hypothetical protein